MDLKYIEDRMKFSERLQSALGKSQLNEKDNEAAFRSPWQGVEAILQMPDPFQQGM